jgi:hypothetical protein
MLESRFQSELIEELRELFPGCVILKNDPNYIQGFPDLLILHKDRWAALEVKRSASATHQPNQDWYVELLDNLAFAAFIYPENKVEILDALQLTLRARRSARNTQRVQLPLAPIHAR